MNLFTLQLDALAKDLARRDAGQISHGLNLVLKLKSPADMPAMLIAIRAMQRKIDAGLAELNFVHYARFLPSPDFSAMQVITEFDGALAPYVLDFAIEIGDVFDMLLGFTQGTEHIVPVADHADAFLAFVEAHNTITIASVGEVKDWPLYASYPEKSVVEIMGARTDLPMPKADRWPTPIAREDIQGNILHGYRAARVRHFMLQVVDPPKARIWLANKATPDESLGGFPNVTSYRLWSVGAEPDLMLNVGLTYPGMIALGIRDSWLAAFPTAFKEGPVRRAADNFDIAGNSPDHWWLGGPGQEKDIHVLLSLYEKAEVHANFDIATQALVAALTGAGLKLLAKQEATARGGRSWFGYADGIANPRIATACPESGDRLDLQPSATPGEFLLGSYYRNIYGGNSLGQLPAALATNGSFCAVRVLAQDTTAFTNTLKAEASRLGKDAEWLAAKLVGRWYDGAALSLNPDAPSSNPSDNKRNDFDFVPSYEYPDTPMDHLGQRCPAGAHIRRTNPRTARIVGARYSRRLMRRGMHYENIDPQGIKEVGLFGMFFCADLERQFEFIQRQWINGDVFTSGIDGTRDPIVGTAIQAQDEFDIPMPGGAALKMRLPQFVFTRGSLYLFMPGLTALRQLDRYATTDPPPAQPSIPASAASAIAIAALDRPTILRGILSVLSAEQLLTIALSVVGNPRPVSVGATARSRTVARQELDPRRRSFQQNPYPVYAAFRASDPVHYSSLYGGWFVFGYKDVVRVCSNNDEFTATDPNPRPSLLGPESPGLFGLDDPEHQRILTLVSSAWRSGATDTSKFIARSIDRTLSALGDRSCFDLVDDFARPIPRDVYYDILGGAGIDLQERAQLDQLARTIMKTHDHTLNPLERMNGYEAAMKMGGRLTNMLQKASLHDPRFAGSFLAHLAPLVDDRNPTLMNQVVAVTTLVNITVAGYMSVEFLLATGVRRLLLNGGAGWRALLNDPALLPLYLEEMRRTDHALAVVDRFAKLDLTIGSCFIPKDSPVFGVLASANRDERIFGTDADQFNPHRPWPRPHIAFGTGVHPCMGKALENAISVPTLTRALAVMPGLRLLSAAQPPWFENFYFRSFDHLQVTLK